MEGSIGGLWPLISLGMTVLSAWGSAGQPPGGGSFPKTGLDEGGLGGGGEGTDYVVF